MAPARPLLVADVGNTTIHHVHPTLTLEGLRLAYLHAVARTG